MLQGIKIADACDAASVKAFPTWVIGGQNIEGELDLAQLEDTLSKLQDKVDAGTPTASSAVAAAANQ